MDAISFPEFIESVAAVDCWADGRDLAKFRSRFAEDPKHSLLAERLVNPTLLRDAIVRELVPLALEASGLPRQAKRLRLLWPLRTKSDFGRALQLARDILANHPTRGLPTSFAVSAADFNQVQDILLTFQECAQTALRVDANPNRVRTSLCRIAESMLSEESQERFLDHYLVASSPEFAVRSEYRSSNRGRVD